MSLSAPKAWSIALLAPFAIVAAYLMVSATHSYLLVAMATGIINPAIEII